MEDNNEQRILEWRGGFVIKGWGEKSYTTLEDSTYRRLKEFGQG